MNVKVQGRTVRKNKLKEQLGKRAKPEYRKEHNNRHSSDARQFSY